MFGHHEPNDQPPATGATPNREAILDRFSIPWALNPPALATLENRLVRLLDGQPLPAPRAAVGNGMMDRRAALNGQARVAVIPIDGVLVHSTDWLSEYLGEVGYGDIGMQVDAAVADPSIDVLLFIFSTPGGSTQGVIELATKIAEASARKKCIGVIDPLCASAGYWLASQCSEISITPSGDVGSIGVYLLVTDASKLLERVGVKITAISAGKFKTAGAPFEPLSDASRAVLQKGVDELYAEFVATVARGRGVPPSRVLSGFGQGACVHAKEALAENMVDRIETVQQAYTRAVRGGAIARAATDQKIKDCRDQLARDEKFLSSVRETAASGDRSGIEIRKRRLLLDQSVVPAIDPAAAYESRRVVALALPKRRRPEAQAPTGDAVLWGVALEESGHACACLAMGIGFESITATADADSLGRLTWRDNDDPKRAHDEALAVVLFAGPAAQSLNELSRRPVQMGERDARILSLRCPDQAKQRRARETACAFVKIHAAAVRLVACKLLGSGRRTLSSEMVAAYCKEAGAPC